MTIPTTARRTAQAVYDQKLGLVLGLRMVAKKVVVDMMQMLR
nr:hypothetical protein [Chroococcidiopsis sp. SAG 2025]